MLALPEFPIPDLSRSTEESKGLRRRDSPLAERAPPEHPRHSKLCAIDPMDCQWHSLR